MSRMRCIARRLARWTNLFRGEVLPARRDSRTLALLRSQVCRHGFVYPLRVFLQPPTPPDESHPRYAMPEWWGPPDNWMGINLPIDVILARSERAALVVGALTAYPAGFAFDVLATAPDNIDVEEVGFMHFGRPRSTDLAAMLRIRLRFADGTTVEEDDLRARLPNDQPTTPVLRRSSGGGGSSFRLNLWAWPLPPPGPMSLVCEWPGRGSEHILDGSAIREAADRCVEVWPPGEPLHQFNPSR
jgi:hypothetical protein